MHVAHDEGHCFLRAAIEDAAEAVNAKFAPAGREVRRSYLFGFLRSHKNIIRCSSGVLVHVKNADTQDRYVDYFVAAGGAVVTMFASHSGLISFKFSNLCKKSALSRTSSVTSRPRSSCGNPTPPRSVQQG